MLQAATTAGAKVLVNTEKEKNRGGGTKRLIFAQEVQETTRCMGRCISAAERENTVEKWAFCAPGTSC